MIIILFVFAAHVKKKIKKHKNKIRSIFQYFIFCMPGTDFILGPQFKTHSRTPETKLIQ